MEVRSRPEPAPPRRRAAALLTAAVAVLGGCGGEAGDNGGSTPGRPPAATTLLWRELGAWNGRGDRQTESFEIASGALRLVWRTHDEDELGAGMLRVSLHSAISGRPLEVMVEQAGVGSDTVRLSAGPRVAYMFIESSGIEWSVRLEEGVAADRATNGSPQSVSRR